MEYMTVTSFQDLGQGGTIIITKAMDQVVILSYSQVVSAELKALNSIRRDVKSFLKKSFQTREAALAQASPRNSLRAPI